MNHIVTTLTFNNSDKVIEVSTVATGYQRHWSEGANQTVNLISTEVYLHTQIKETTGTNVLIHASMDAERPANEKDYMTVSNIESIRSRLSTEILDCFVDKDIENHKLTLQFKNRELITEIEKKSSELTNQILEYCKNKERAYVLLGERMGAKV